MNEFENQEGSSSETVPVQPYRGPMGQHKFSTEELRVLNQCNSESFYQRSLPLSTIMGMATYSAVRGGYFKPNPRFGAFPKVSMAVMMGYFVGKLSYQQACAEKLMALPGSYIGQLLRDRKDGKLNYQHVQKPSLYGANSSDIYSDAGPGSALDLDTDRPLFNEDSYHPDSGGQPADLSPSRPELSYEDLRRKNRGNYGDSRQDPYRVDAGTTPPMNPRRPPLPSEPSTNKYGDAME